MIHLEKPERVRPRRATPLDSGVYTSVDGAGGPIGRVQHSKFLLRVTDGRNVKKHLRIPGRKAISPIPIGSSGLVWPFGASCLGRLCGLDEKGAWREEYNLERF